MDGENPNRKFKNGKFLDMFKENEVEREKKEKIRSFTVQYMKDNHEDVDYDLGDLIDHIYEQVKDQKIWEDI